jgi:hypothetical protein
MEVSIFIINVHQTAANMKQYTDHQEPLFCARKRGGPKRISPSKPPDRFVSSSQYFLTCKQVGVNTYSFVLQNMN